VGPHSSSGPILQFGPYEFDCRRGALRKGGRFLKLQPQPARVLALLLSRPGDLILREELARELWGDATVDVDRALNFSIRRLRATLNDDHSTPVYIETVPRRGYRFIASVNPKAVTLEAEPAKAVPEVLAATTLRAAQPEKGPGHSWRKMIALVAAGAAGLALLVWPLLHSFSPKVTSITRVTSDGNTKVPVGPCCVVIANDGSTVYFSEMVEGRWRLNQVAAAGGEVSALATPFANTGVSDISPKGLGLLTLGWELESALWNVPVPSGSPRKVGNIVAHDAVWSPDGAEIVYCRGFDLYVAKADGTEPHLIATFDKLPFRPRWSPDRSKLRFTLYDSATGHQSLWESDPNGAHPHPLFPGNQRQRDECCGVWMPGGEIFVYQSTIDGVSHLQAMREGGHFLGAGGQEQKQITAGPISFLGPSPSPDGKRIFAVGLQARGELMRYEASAKQFADYLGGISAAGLDFSKDGEWVTYTTYPEGALFRSRANGEQPVQLTPSDLRADLPRWSPDDKSIVFSGSKAGGPWKIYRLSSDGGNLEQLVPGDGPEFDAGLSPDGKVMVYADSVVARSPVLHFMNPSARRISTIPGSAGLFSPRWSPDGHWIVALTTDSMNMKMFNVRTQVWESIVEGRHVAYPSWSKDSKNVYFCSPMEANAPFYQFHVESRRLELMAEVRIPRGLAPGPSGWWCGATPDGSPLILRDSSMQEVYALTVKF